MLQEPEIERPEHQDDPDVGHQPRPEVVPEEQDVHANHDDYHREHIKPRAPRTAREVWSTAPGLGA